MKLILKAKWFVIVMSIITTGCLDENNQLYLIDWDGAVVADPAIDIGTLLYWYIPRESWEILAKSLRYEVG